MYSIALEDRLILPDVRDVMADVASLQLDMDDQKIKGIALVAQDLDLKRILNSNGEDNLSRCINPQTDEDDTLRDLVIMPWIYYTYARCLKMTTGALTEAGCVVEKTVLDSKELIDEAYNTYYSIADAYMAGVIDHLNDETETDVDVVAEDVLVPRIRVFGGEENRSSN